jgi:hypothetical protein
MTELEKLKQEEHDKVIDTLYTEYKKQYPKVWKNPNQEKNVKITEHPDIYPDILVANDQNILQFIEEVEIEDTVTEAHAKEQWVPYSKVNTTFYLRVPLGSQNEARKILTDLKITATVRCYSITKNPVTKTSEVTLISC